MKKKSEFNEENIYLNDIFQKLYKKNHLSKNKIFQQKVQQERTNVLK